MRTRIVSDPAEARRIWDSLSPFERPFDEWDLRACFWRPYGYDLRFIVAEDGDRPVGLLPLQWNTGRGAHERYHETDGDFLEFFGGGYPFDNRPFLAAGYEGTAGELFAAIDRPARIIELAMEPLDEKFVHWDDDYVLSLEGFAGAEEYLAASFSNDHKKDILRTARRIEESGTEIVAMTPDDLDLLFDWGIERFGEDSSHAWRGRREAFRSMLALGRFDWHCSSFLVDWRKEAVSIALRYGDVFYSFGTVVSYRVKRFALYCRLKKIDLAIRLGCREYDALTGDSGWKPSWHFEARPRYEYVRGE